MRLQDDAPEIAGESRYQSNQPLPVRRKMRKAEAAGITITLVTPERPRPLPLDEMAEIARDAIARATGSAS